jgi:hypothetical protein
MQIVYAKDWVRAANQTFPPGSHWPADDPFVQANPAVFSEDPRYHLAFTEPRDYYLDPSLDVPVETATAAPGERRNARRP